MDIINRLSARQIKDDLPDFNIGDTVRLRLKIREGENVRKQKFEGTVIQRRGTGIGKTFTVRKISQGIGVERVFPLHSPNIEELEVIREGRVRRAKLYYLRSRLGKSGRVKEKKK
ncbi:MAG: 50S ribosomal protein L19 [Candidatus Latescibacteria bacterium]|nr:50S ribosomal protein L19 [bacterium]MBD3422886.1 50S ribosomal protein L19 [Candidatus Latescibacterota bacterium]